MSNTPQSTEPKGKAGRKPMTEAQKEASRVGRGLKELAPMAAFGDPAVWAGLSPVILAQAEAAIKQARIAKTEDLKKQIAAAEVAQEQLNAITSAQV